MKGQWNRALSSQEIVGLANGQNPTLFVELYNSLLSYIFMCTVVVVVTEGLFTIALAMVILGRFK